MAAYRVNESVRWAVRCALAGTAAALLAGPAVAADATADDDVQEVVVTGSRVRGAAPVGSTVITLGAEQIASTGQVTLDRAIKELPQNFDLGVSENSRGQSGGNGNIVYGNTVNLRGIGPYATLVMLDGHRVVNNSRSTDPSIIPTLGIERVEVVADGASAIYGSDAVAGVVNLIPRRSLDGVEAFARYGVADGYNEYVAGAAWGMTAERGQLMVAYEHAHRDNLSGADRGFFRNDQRSSGGRDYRVTRCNPGTLRIGTTTYAIPAAGLTPATAGQLVAGSTNRCDELPGQDLFPQQTYNSINMTGTYDVNDRVAVLVDAFYNKREFTRLPAFASATLTVPQTNAWFVRPAGFTGTSYQVDYSFINDLPQNRNTGSSENWQVTPTVRFKLGGSWQAEALVAYGRNEDDSDTFQGTNNTALNAALASPNPATAFDPYGLNRTTDTVRAGIANQIFLAPTNNRFVGYEARINGSLYTMAGGDLGLAAGYEGQKLDVDLGSARGNPGTPVAFRSFSRQVDSGYVELLAPFVGAANARPGIQRLALSAAVRYDNYDDVGDTTNTKFGLSYSPTETVALRASYGTSFRAPLISQIYGNSNNLFVQSYTNPVAGGVPFQGVAQSGANLALGPEEAETWTVGVDWNPIDALSLSLTYWDVKYDSQVESYLSNLAILARESEFAGTGVILRGTAARDRVLALLGQGVTLAAGSFPGGSPNNVTLFVDGRNQNLGKSVTRGVDLNGSWRFDTAAAGRWTLAANGTYLTTYDLAITGTAPLVDRLDTIFNPLKLKLRASLTWDYEPVSVQLIATHVGAYLNNAITPAQNVSSFTPLDLSVAWNVGDAQGDGLLDGLQLRGEVRNLLDEEPPYVNIAPTANGSGGYDATASNPIGRLYAVSLRKKW
jgi:iron complex outermembrane recepter protein